MKKKTFLCILACIVAVTLNDFASAQIAATLTGDVRLAGDLDELPTGGNVGDENGGSSNLVIGINTGNVDNFALLGFDTSLATGEVVTGATITIGVQTAFTGGGNHGSVADTLSIHELFSTNAGWVPGSQGVANTAANVAANGVVSFQNQAHGTGGTLWQDAAGTDVDNLLGAFDSTAPIATIGGWEQGAAPASIEFTFDATTAQQWADAGFIDLVIQVNDNDENSMSRFNLTNGTASLSFVTDLPVLLGDVNTDGVVDFLDIAPFITLLSTGVFQAEADVDDSGQVDFLDISPFIVILSS